MSRNRTIKDRHASVNKGRYPSVIDYVDKMTEWKQWPGKIIDGIGYVLFHNHWIEEVEFLKYQPMPQVPSFRTDLTNIDTQNI